MDLAVLKDGSAEEDTLDLAKKGATATVIRVTPVSGADTDTPSIQTKSLPSPRGPGSRPSPRQTSGQEQKKAADDKLDAHQELAKSKKCNFVLGWLCVTFFVVAVVFFGMALNQQHSSDAFQHLYETCLNDRVANASASSSTSL